MFFEIRYLNNLFFLFALAETAEDLCQPQGCQEEEEGRRESRDRGRATTCGTIIKTIAATATTTSLPTRFFNSLMSLLSDLLHIVPGDVALISRRISLVLGIWESQ